MTAHMEHAITEAWMCLPTLHEVCLHYHHMDAALASSYGSDRHACSL